MNALLILLIVIFAVLGALVVLLKLWLTIRRCERLARSEEEALIRQPPRAPATIYKSTIPRHQNPPPAY